MNKSLPSTAALLTLLQIICLPLFSQWNSDNTINNPVVVNQGEQTFFTSCSDGAGGAIIAWYDNRGVSGNIFYDVYVQRINSNGQTVWTAGGVSLGVVTTGVGDIDITEDGSGGAVVVFIVGSGSTLNIAAQRLDANGNKLWNNGSIVNVCTAQEAQFLPKVANAGGSSYVVVWADERSGSNSDDLYAQKYDANGVAQWTVNGVVVNAALNSQASPEIIGIGNGEVLVTWQDQRSGSADVYCQKLNAAGVRQWRGLDNLLSGKAICTASGNQVSPKICADGSTGAIIGWQDYRMGTATNGDIYAQRIDSSGQVKWTANGVALCSTATTQEIAAITFTGDGAAICWTDLPPGNDFTLYDIYAQKVDTTGVPKWGTDGVVVCNAPDLQNVSRAAGDGNGGAFFTWIDRREGGLSDTKIYGQRINSNGTAAWAANGALICGNPNYSRVNPDIVASACTAIFIWEDQRNSCCGTGDTDIFATKLNCDGSVSGASSGITWTGTISTNWMTAGNWSSNAVPAANDAVTVPAGTPFSPVVNTGVMAVCKTLKINTGATVTIATGGDLKVTQ